MRGSWVGSTATETVPKQVGTASSWAGVSAGYHQACGTQTSGELWCWGYNSSGQLGVGNTTNQLTPARVGTNSTWSSVTAARFHTCATHTGGTLWCWGIAAGERWASARTSTSGLRCRWDQRPPGQPPGQLIGTTAAPGSSTAACGVGAATPKANWPTRHVLCDHGADRWHRALMVNRWCRRDSHLRDADRRHLLVLGQQHQRPPRHRRHDDEDQPHQDWQR